MFYTAGSALLSGVTDDVARRVNDYSAQHIAVTSWAFAKLETSPRPALMQVISLIESFDHCDVPAPFSQHYL